MKALFVTVVGIPGATGIIFAHLDALVQGVGEGVAVGSGGRVAVADDVADGGVGIPDGGSALAVLGVGVDASLNRRRDHGLD